MHGNLKTINIKKQTLYQVRAFCADCTFVLPTLSKVKEPTLILCRGLISLTQFCVLWTDVFKIITRSEKKSKIYQRVNEHVKIAAGTEKAKRSRWMMVPPNDRND